MSRDSIGDGHEGSLIPCSRDEKQLSTHNVVVSHITTSCKWGMGWEIVSGFRVPFSLSLDFT